MMVSPHDQYDIFVELYTTAKIKQLTNRGIQKFVDDYNGTQNIPPMVREQYDRLIKKHEELEQKETQLRQILDESTTNCKTINSNCDDENDQVFVDDKRMKRPPKLIRAHLPFQQRTSIAIKKGTTLEMALYKALSVRHLNPEMCIVHAKDTDKVISWDTYITNIHCNEIIVDIIDSIVMHNSTIHDFVKKYFFRRRVCCEVCNKYVYIGYICRSCNYHVHTNCSQNIPAACKRYSKIDTPTSKLSPDNKGHQSEINTTFRRQTLKTYGSNERSSSAPDVCCNITNTTTTNHECSTSIMANTPSQGSSHAKASQSTGASPTNKIRLTRQRARSADESANNRILDDYEFIRDPELIEEWEINHHALLIDEKKIGAGTFGTVYKAMLHGCGWVAVKKLHASNPTTAQAEAFVNEVMVLRKTRHVNILQFMGMIRTPYLAIVTQWCGGSSLYHCLHLEEVQYNLLQILYIASQTALGMEYLHAKNIIHRDLKSNNILFIEQLSVTIADFGLAKVKHLSTKQQSCQPSPSGSIYWMAPEVCKMKKDENPYSFQSDIYSYGIVLYELMTRKLPYANLPDKNTYSIFYRVGSGLLKPDLSILPEKIPKILRTMLENCIAFNSEERPSFKTILNDLRGLISSLPLIDRSASDPNISSNFHSEDDYLPYSPPKSPGNFHSSSKYKNSMFI